MKLSPILTARPATFLLFAATLWLPLAESNAQESKPKPERVPAATNSDRAVTAPNAAKDSRAKIDVVDASIQELARLLEAQFEGANFVVPQTVANVRVTLKLRNVTLDQALQAIGFATENRVLAEEITENVYGFRLIPRTMPDGQPEPQTAVRVLSLAGAPQLGGEASPDTFKKVVEELELAFNDAIAMLREADPASTVEQPRLKFHPSTRLLVAVGKPEELNIVEQLVAALGGGFAPVNAGFSAGPGGPAIPGLPGFFPGSGAPGAVPGGAPPIAMDPATGLPLPKAAPKRNR